MNAAEHRAEAERNLAAAKVEWSLGEGHGHPEEFKVHLGLAQVHALLALSADPPPSLTAAQAHIAIAQATMIGGQRA